MNSEKTIAVLIDADNAPASKFDLVLNELANVGMISIRRAYGNWKKDNLKQWEKILFDYAIVPVQQYDLTKDKNASDIALSVDAMEILFTKEIDIFCIISSDCDFTPLVTKLLGAGKYVYGFGEEKTPEPFKNVCSKFLILNTKNQEEKVGVEKVNNNQNKRSGTELKQDTKLMNLLRNAIEITEDEDGWSNLSDIGRVISNQTPFDSRNYGYKSLNALVKEINKFEIKKVKNTYMIRDKNKNN